jgi:hypothetical protein
MPSGTEGHRHFILQGFTSTERYQRPSGGGKRQPVPEQDRASHSATLLRQLHAVQAAAEGLADEVEGLGLNVEFESFPDVELAFESLARERSGIELLNVRHDATRTYATVFVPNGRLPVFERLIVDYLQRKRDRRNRPRDNQRLVDAIHQIRTASLQALWTDAQEALPTSEVEPFWWEVWLPVRRDAEGGTEAFRHHALQQGLQFAAGESRFPERVVVLVKGSAAQMRSSVLVLNSIAELRRAKVAAGFFDGMPRDEQAQWVNDLLARATYPSAGADVPHVCLLDTGVNRGHPLLAPALHETDLHSVEPVWGTDDAEGHGTKMAGLALVGKLAEALASSEPLEIEHRLESVKLLQAAGANTDPLHYGYLTAEAVSRPEIRVPGRSRVFGMALTAEGQIDRGRPSSWSSEVDGLAADAAGEGATPRLLILSAGNVRDPSAWARYPDSNDTDSIEDPAQAWNALTVGACTHLVGTPALDAALVPVAEAGGLSPFSRTSLTWEGQWPLKPDLVLEGGNAARDGLGAVWSPELSLLTSNHRMADALLTTANATSAATALAARMAAQIMAAYPGLWPETVRGLLVHSAAWTDKMRAQFLPASGVPSKRDYAQLVRRCGLGEPDLTRALWTLRNSLTLILQERLTPFQRASNKDPGLKELNLHALPWPREALEALFDTPVEMRVTLSYFIEPNPSARGLRSRYRYPSHGLRFDVKRPLESGLRFRKRINAAAREDEQDTPESAEDAFWLLGPQGRHRGSLHCDIWRGRAAELASRETIAVYPAVGWWKTRPHLNRFNKAARYALLVTIHVPDIEVDLYTEVANQIGVQVPSGL